MIQTRLPDGTIKETYDSLDEFNKRGEELSRIMGRRKMFYNGWLNGQLTRIYR